MTMTRVVVCLGLALTYVVCVRCQCTPDRWEGYQHGLAGYDRNSNDHKGFAVEGMQVHYDAVKNRTATLVRYQAKGIVKHFYLVSLYQQDTGTQYVVDMDNGECKRRQLHKGFKKLCLPDNARYEGELSLGPANTFKVSRYSLTSTDHVRYYLVYHLGKDYIPVQETGYGNFGKYSGVETMVFNDVTVGIKHESIFDVPEKCETNDDFFHLAAQLAERHFSSLF